MPWQQHVADLALEVDPATGRLAYREVRLTVPRQSGKTTLILAKNIWRMADAAALGGRQNLVYVAQSRNKAREKFVDDYLEELKASKLLNGRWRTRLSNGSESIRWENGSRWGIESTTEKAGHGPTLDVGDIDEAFAQVDDRAEQAMKPAMITRPQPQLWVVSTAGTQDSYYLNDKVDRGRELAAQGVDRGICYIEWSALESADPADPATWRSCMPALGLIRPDGTGVTEQAIADDFASMKLPEFCRAYLNWRNLGEIVEAEIGAAAWAGCADRESVPQPRPAWIAVETSKGMRSAAVAIAGRRSDGRAHLELLAYSSGADWVARLVAQKQSETGAPVIVLAGAGSSSAALIPELEAAGVSVTPASMADFTSACTGLQSSVEARDVVHLGDPIVAAALAAAATKDVGDAGGWRWSARHSGSDISPLVALTLAHWGLLSAPPIEVWGFVV
jgi:phage terminase large subunit-like protein